MKIELTDFEAQTLRDVLRYYRDDATHHDRIECGLDPEDAEHQTVTRILNKIQ